MIKYISLILIIALFFSCEQYSLRKGETITISKANSPFIIAEDYTIPASTHLIIKKGTEIILSDSVNIHIYGKLTIEGTKKNPIIFKPITDSISWGRIIINSKENIKIRNAKFINGAITAYNSKIYIANSSFIFNQRRTFDGWPIIYFHKSTSSILNNTIINNTNRYVGEGINLIEGTTNCSNNTVSFLPDAIEFTRIINSNITGNIINNAFDDAIDINACKNIIIKNNFIKNADDKGISIGGDKSFADSIKYGNSTNILLKNNFIINTKIGISITDSSFVNIEKNNICKSKIGIKLYRKRELDGGAFATAKNNILIDNKTDFIIENSDFKNENTISNKKSENTRKYNLNFIDSAYCIRTNDELTYNEYFRLNNIDTTKIISKNNLPSIFINTFPKEILNDERIKASYLIFENNTETNSGKLSIEIRGSSSASFPKKSYELTINDKQSILNLPKNKDWVLYGPWYDKSLLRNAITYSIGNKLSIKSPKYKFTNLYINGEDKGLYLISQKIKRNKNFVNIKKLTRKDSISSKISGGYIFKIDKGTGANNWVSLCSSKNNDLAKYYLHYPKPKNANKSQKEYLKNYINNFESSLTKIPVDLSIIDTASFIDYVIITELMKNFDGYRASLYFYKNRESNKLFIGPIWDFNISSGKTLTEEFNKPTGFVFEINKEYRKYIPNWWYNLLSDENFSKVLVKRWNYLRQNKLSDKEIIILLNNLTNEVKYYSNNEEIEYLEKWVTNRIAWLDKNISSIDQKSKTYIK